MGQFARLPAALLIRLGLVPCCGVLLVGVLLLTLATPPPAPTTTTALVLVTSISPTPGTHPSSTASATKGSGTKGQAAQAPSWLVEGLIGAFVALLSFSLIVFPIAARAIRAERLNRPAITVAPPRRPSGQVARLSQIPPERKEPLSREQMLALRDSQKLQAVSALADQSTGSLAAVRMVNGVPIALPITESETPPQIAAARPPKPQKVVEGTTGELPAVRYPRMVARHEQL